MERFVVDLMEQFRVESLAPQALAGVHANLRHRFRHWAVTAHDTGLTGTAAGLVLHTTAEMARFRINGDPNPAETERITEAPRFALGPRIGHQLVQLRRCRGDQSDFAGHARELAACVAGLVGTEESATSPRPARSRGERALAGLLGRGEDRPRGSDDPGHPACTGSAHRPGYRVLTTTYDRERRASELVRPARLAEHRRHLDVLLSRRPAGRRGLVRRLQAEFSAAVVADTWDQRLEAGQVDGRRLAGLVVSPGERLIFADRAPSRLADAHVTVLLDCSGSMRRHAGFTAVLVDVLARALEEAGIPCAVLGFTTSSWNGGRARRDWRRARYPKDPGRVAERLHIVFKEADQPWRRRRREIAALLQQDLFREGLDGEAVEWAVSRTAGSDHRRRVVLVVSDGGPAESATADANQDDLLDRHLVDVVAAATRAGCEVAGLGLGRDLTSYYPRSLVLAAERVPTPATFREVVGVLQR
ncbi:Aerobic cobaltochelatase CobT subunit [Pseudonocardia sp. Ae168_Ps1]|nr:Aerobic cobaltochelatase CobT subunit [Pseudonocardia sp. Ae150A_Ps1]OLL78181.1 Aerobic cobaltochelatase CobT subunit [Pseudonocardia sp. Ae168_Ps1]